jgi:hypothetical protein
MNEVEDCLKAILKKHQYRKRKEIYQIDLDILKEIMEGCEELMIRKDNELMKKNKLSKNHNYFLLFENEK